MSAEFRPIRRPILDPYLILHFASLDPIRVSAVEFEIGVGWRVGNGANFARGDRIQLKRDGHQLTLVYRAGQEVWLNYQPMFMPRRLRHRRAIFRTILTGKLNAEDTRNLLNLMNAVMEEAAQAE